MVVSQIDFSRNADSIKTPKKQQSKNNKPKNSNVQSS